jgi:hypothetical protein
MSQPALVENKENIMNSNLVDFNAILQLCNDKIVSEKEKRYLLSPGEKTEFDYTVKIQNLIRGATSRQTHSYSHKVSENFYKKKLLNDGRIRKSLLKDFN